VNTVTYSVKRSLADITILNTSVSLDQ